MRFKKFLENYPNDNQLGNIDYKGIYQLVSKKVMGKYNEKITNSLLNYGFNKQESHQIIKKYRKMENELFELSSSSQSI